MPFVHIVLFGFKAEASREEIHNICKEMLALGQKCIHPTTKTTYIRSSMGGVNNSKEGFSGASSHGFVMWFDSEADRDYYVHEDVAHKEFVKLAQPLLADVRVVDFETGVFDGGLFL